MKPNVLIDFDGVIHKYSKGIHDCSLYDSPVDGVKDFIDSIKDKYRVVIFTARLCPVFDIQPNITNEDIADWMNKHNIYYDEITYKKLPAVAYIDDLGINFSPEAGCGWTYVKESLRHLDRIARKQIGINTWEEFEDRLKEIRGE
jgi:hypothetical protein